MAALEIIPPILHKLPKDRLSCQFKLFIVQWDSVAMKPMEHQVLESGVLATGAAFLEFLTRVDAIPKEITRDE